MIKSTSDFTLAMMWTAVGIIDIISCAMGEAPTWILVLCPVITLIATYWIKALMK